MNFSEISTEVADITKRPDLVTSRIPAAVSAATLKAHMSDFFYKDIVEVAIEFDVARNIQTFDPKSILPTYRQAKYIRLWDGDTVTGTAGQFLDHIQVQNSIDTYGYIKTNVYYMSGEFLQIRGTLPVLKCLFGCYRYPIITEAQYQSWIAAEVPYAIIYEASRQILAQTGADKRAAGMQLAVREEYGMLASKYVDVVPE